MRGKKDENTRTKRREVKERKNWRRRRRRNEDIGKEGGGGKKVIGINNSRELFSAYNYCYRIHFTKIYQFQSAVHFIRYGTQYSTLHSVVQYVMLLSTAVSTFLLLRCSRRD
jgi:hypothetical protein